MLSIQHHYRLLNIFFNAIFFSSPLKLYCLFSPYFLKPFRYFSATFPLVKQVGGRTVINGAHLVSTKVSIFLHYKINLENLNSKSFLRAGAIRPFLVPSRLQVLIVLQHYLVKYEVLLYLVLSSEQFLTEGKFMSPSRCRRIIVVQCALVGLEEPYDPDPAL